MTEELINYNGKTYKLSYNGTLSQEQKYQSIEKATRQLHLTGCRSCGSGNGITKLAATCPTTIKNVGDIVSLQATPMNGIAPYTVKFQKNGVDIPSGIFTGVGEGVAQNYSYILTSSDVSPVRLGSYIVDSCSTPMNCTEFCDITIGAPPPPPKYRCDTATNSCVEDPNGPYTDLASCQAACAAPPPTGCTTATKNVGDVVVLNAAGTTGTAPFTITFKRNGVIIQTFTGIQLGVNQSLSYTIVAADSPTVTLSTDVSDSCTNPGPQLCSQQCIVNVAPLAPPRYSCTGAPNYQCVEDPNGQYTDLASCQAACIAPPVCILPKCTFTVV